MPTIPANQTESSASNAGGNHADQEKHTLWHPPELSAYDEFEVPEELLPLVPVYLESVTSQILALRDAVEAGNFEGARRIGHNLKGTGASYGFPGVSVAGSLIETAASGGEGGDVLRIAVVVEEQLGLHKRAAADTIDGSEEVE